MLPQEQTPHTHAHNGWLGMDQGSAGAFDKRLPQWTAPALLCSCPPALLQLLLLLLLLALLAACCWLVLADLSYVQQTIVCVCTYMHIRAYNMYMYIFRKRTCVCVCVVCWCRGRVSSVSSLVLLSHFWPLFLPLAQCPHPGSGLPQSRFRGLMQKEASRSRGANPPLPLPVNTEKKHKTRTGPFSDLQFQPGVVHRSVPQHLTHLPMPTYITSRGTDLLLLRAHKTPCDKRVSRLSCVPHGPPTVRVRYGTVRYGTSRVESSPVSTRAAFNIPSIGIDPVPMPFRDRQTFSCCTSLCRPESHPTTPALPLLRAG